jgi:pyruvate/2-oxoglutarate dehydrogenase complex dihydrolipoamide acyltransferase (E2) component
MNATLAAGGVSTTPQATPLPVSPPANPLIPLKGLRGTIARNMTVGWQAPRVAMGAEVDMSTCLARLVELQAKAGSETRITVTAIVLRAVALTLREHPKLNALMREGGIEPMAQIHLGLAVALDDGLAVPVVRDADTKPVEALAAESRALATGTRAGTLPPKAYQSATFTVTNLGMTGIDWFTPILNPPQVGILGLSRVVDRAVVREHQIVIAPMTTLTLVFDHRAVDGHPAALFLRDLRTRLESGVGL